MKGKTMTCISFPCQPYFSRKNSLLKKQKLHDLHKYYCCAKIKSGSKNFENRITTSFSYKASVKAPLNEFPWASFDQYIEDKERVIQAIIPEKSTAKKLNETRCELEDLHYDHIPLGLNINAKGALYLEKEGRHNLIKNQIHITLSFVVPLLLKLVPEHVLQNILHSVLRSYVEDICNKGIGVRLLEDYNSFKMNKSEKTV
ncbi:hypothetical protein KIW84_011829 [Lathyrus oleraceus]|uniref:Uncharacterized protein n=1 Tax=Pisum sativum TaxID=3888 RepID=A0A9D5GVP5_PEA|nr:hypothetical protein KIW84_011829 [Pisum sativum]KAI5442939.1 hypothetical protein KIW84_011829 [Pisum sativum]